MVTAMVAESREECSVGAKGGVLLHLLMMRMIKK